MKLFIAIPVICILVSYFSFEYSATFYWKIHIYFSLLHFVQQQYGWMMAAAKSGEKISKLDLWFDKLIIYNATIYPVIWWHVHDIGFVWRTDKNAHFFDLPIVDYLDVITFIHFSLIFIYCSRQLQMYLMGKGFQLSKNIIWLMTWVVWYIPIIEIQSLLAVYIAQSLAHGIPYMYLTSIYGNAHRSSGSSFSKIIFYSKYKIIFLGLFLLAMFSFNTLILPLVLNYFMVTQAIFVTIFFAVSFSHYALDAHIWKGGVLKQLKGSTL